MKILIASDKFKGSLSAQEVGEAIGRGLKKRDKSVEVIHHPMADGGDGSLEVLARHLSFVKHPIKTVDSLGREILAHYFTTSDTAFIELASASGLVLLSENERNPLLTSTLGTGKMIVDALRKGDQNIFLFLGGSATNDAGMGIATALGFVFLDKNKTELQPIGKNLSLVKFIHSIPHFDFKKIKITLLCDVNNPMFGVSGAAYIYAPQKGATEEQVEYLDKGLRNVSNILNRQTGVDVSQLSGSGAAGGVGGGLVALLNAKMAKGFHTISKLTCLEKQIEVADLVISGEGKLDKQSLQGKVVSGVAELCKKYKKPLILIVGKNDLDKKEIAKLENQQIYSIIPKAKNIEDAILNGAAYLEDLGFNLTTVNLSKK